MSRIASLVTATLLAGCVFQDVREQQARIDATCVIEGTAASAAGPDRPIVVGLLKAPGEALEGRKCDPR